MSSKTLSWELITFSSTDLRRALEQISKNEKGFVVVIENDMTLIGTVTDGDIRRHLLHTKKLDLDCSILECVNSDFHSVLQHRRLEKLEYELLEKFKFLPVVDDEGRLIDILTSEPAEFRVGNRVINDDNPCFIIAEVGNNHNGSLTSAYRLVDAAVDAGADCVKFQMRNMEELFKFRDDSSEDLGAQYTFDLLDRFQLTNEELFAVFDYCKGKGLVPLCTPWDEASIGALEHYGMEFYKVASADLTNHVLIKRLIDTGKPLIISTGMSSDSEIIEAVDILGAAKHPYILLHCNSTYPAPFDEINLPYLKRLRELTSNTVGYSGHERGISVSTAAVALGAKVIERHITLDRNMEGNDHKVSLLPLEFKALVTHIREVESALTFTPKRLMSQGELMNREVLGKSIYITENISKDEVFEAQHFGVTSPGKGMQPNKIKDLVGKHAPKSYRAGEFIYEADFTLEEQNLKKNWHFTLRHGIPVRYHDYHKLYDGSSFDIVEFHLSYQDLQLPISDFINGNQQVDLIVHCPELYENDHVLDLVSDDSDYLSKSIHYLEKTIDHVDKLMQFFPQTSRPCLITNVGGFSFDKFYSETWKSEKYLLLEENLRRFDESCVEIIPQTMPPYPWHFGGQRHHNLFVDPQEIIDFCEKYSRRICLDISHTKLATNHLKKSFEQGLLQLAKYTAHLHVADAQGKSGEGLQIGVGEMPFEDVWPLITEAFKHCSFVPEVWQGHTNNGLGFWKAFNQLERFK